MRLALSRPYGNTAKTYLVPAFEMPPQIEITRGHFWTLKSSSENIREFSNHHLTPDGKLEPEYFLSLLLRLKLDA